MPYKRLAIKMFKAEFRKYLLYFLCNAFAVAVFFCFATIFENDAFMNGVSIDYMISSNIYAPSVLMALFLAVFIPYSHNTFHKFREKDYGILRSLGMSKEEMKRNLLYENATIGFVSLLAGLIIGTAMSWLFYLVIHHVIGITELSFRLIPKAYGITSIYFSVLFVISVLVSFFCMVTRSALEMVKRSRKAEQSHHSNLFVEIAGFILLIISFVMMVLLYPMNSNIWLLSLAICFFGSLLIIFNGKSLIDWMEKHHQKQYFSKLFFFSDIKYYYGKNIKVNCVAIWMLFFSLFFWGFSLVSCSSFLNNAITYHPFHIAYTEIDNCYTALDDASMNQLAYANGITITENEKVHFTRNDTYTVYCVDDVNRLLDTKYTVNSGSYIFVYQYDLNDGYEHDVTGEPDEMSFKLDKLDSDDYVLHLNRQQAVTDILWGQINALTDKIILVNADDFTQISTYCSDYHIGGALHLYQVSDWKNSAGFVDTVCEQYKGINQLDTESYRFLKISSRIDSYTTAKQSAYFLVYILFYVFLMMNCSVLIMIHFKLKMEYFDEVNKYSGLYRIGISDSEIKRLLRQKISYTFGIPLYFALTINLLYSYFVNDTYGYGWVSVGYALILSLVVLALYYAIIKIYIQNYLMNLMKSIRGLTCCS